MGLGQLNQKHIWIELTCLMFRPELFPFPAAQEWPVRAGPSTCSPESEKFQKLEMDEIWTGATIFLATILGF